MFSERMWLWPQGILFLLGLFCGWAWGLVFIINLGNLNSIIVQYP